MTTLTASSQLTDGCDVAMANAIDRLIPHLHGGRCTRGGERRRVCVVLARLRSRPVCSWSYSRRIRALYAAVKARRFGCPARGPFPEATASSCPRSGRRHVGHRHSHV